MLLFTPILFVLLSPRKAELTKIIVHVDRIEDIRKQEKINHTNPVVQGINMKTVMIDTDEIGVLD